MPDAYSGLIPVCVHGCIDRKSSTDHSFYSRALNMLAAIVLRAQMAPNTCQEAQTGGCQPRTGEASLAWA